MNDVYVQVTFHPEVGRGGLWSAVFFLDDVGLAVMVATHGGHQVSRVISTELASALDARRHA